MRTINRSIKQILISTMMRNKKEMSIKELSIAVNNEREDINPSHIRGVLNRDIKNGSKTFTRTSRDRYILTPMISN